MKYALVIAMLFLGCSEEPEDLYWVKKYVNGLGEYHFRVENKCGSSYWEYADNVEYKTKPAADSAMSVYVERKRMEWAKEFEPEDIGILGNTIRNDSIFLRIMLIFIFVAGGMIIVAYNRRINRFLCRPLFRPKTKRRRS